MRNSDERSDKLVTSLPLRSPIAESYRTLRTNIQFAAVDKEEVKTILVTSTQPGEGKTVTSANLSIVMAQADIRTVYIHADLRRPTGHKIFGLQNVQGLTTYLVGQASLEEIIQETDIPNLQVITSGPIPPNPAELLASKKMERFLDELKEIFDMIIIDTPPVLAVTDATILSKKVDGCVLVVSSGVTSKEMAAKAKRQLTNAKAPLLGVILNNKQISKKEHNTYYYYESEEKEEDSPRGKRKKESKRVGKGLFSRKSTKSSKDPIKDMIEEKIVEEKPEIQEEPKVVRKSVVFPPSKKENGPKRVEKGISLFSRKSTKGLKDPIKDMIEEKIVDEKKEIQEELKVVGKLPVTTPSKNHRRSRTKRGR